MTDKQRITETLKAYTKKHNISASSVILEEYAEELIRKGVVVPTRCKDCIHRGRPQCGFWFDDNENKIQERWDYPDGFCSYGERRDGV